MVSSSGSISAYSRKAGGQQMEEMEVPPTENRRRKRTSVIVFLVIAGTVVVFLKWYGSFFRHSYHPRVRAGHPAPVFTFPGLDGKMVSLADYKGKVVFLNIWATWCPPCREEMPSMEKLYRQLKGEDFEILAVSVDASGAEAVGPFMKAHTLTFPALLDPGGEIQDLYGTTGIPESFIIGREGRIEKVVIGALDWTTPQAVRFFRNLLQRPYSGS
jgi:peroxiredoxin